MAKNPTYTRKQCQLIDAMFAMVASGLKLVEEDIDWAAGLRPERVPAASLERLEQMRQRLVLVRLIAELIATARWSPDHPTMVAGASQDDQPRYSKKIPILESRPRPDSRSDEGDA